MVQRLNQQTLQIIIIYSIQKSESFLQKVPTHTTYCHHLQFQCLIPKSTLIPQNVLAHLYSFNHQWDESDLLGCVGHKQLMPHKTGEVNAEIREEIFLSPPSLQTKQSGHKSLSAVIPMGNCKFPRGLRRKPVSTPINQKSLLSSGTTWILTRTCPGHGGIYQELQLRRFPKWNIPRNMSKTKHRTAVCHNPHHSTVNYPLVLRGSGTHRLLVTFYSICSHQPQVGEM